MTASYPVQIRRPLVGFPKRNLESCFASHLLLDGYQKYWFAHKVTEGWCVIRDETSTLSIGMSFPSAKVPYLGMWLNEGGYCGQYNIAPEPATAAMDRIDFAKMWGMGSVLAPKSRYEWHLAITLGEGKEPHGMSPSGQFIY